MNLENIREGIRVPNYRKLCELLEEKAEAGNSKNAQLRKWNQFFGEMVGAIVVRAVRHHNGQSVGVEVGSYKVV